MMKNDVPGKDRIKIELDILKDMAAGVAHDLNNMLTGVIGFCSLSMEEVKEGDPLKENLREIYRNGEDIKSFAEKLMWFSRMEFPEKHPIALREAVETAVENVKRAWGDKVSVKLSSEMDGLVLADEDIFSLAVEFILSSVLRNSRSPVDIDILITAVNTDGAGIRISTPGDNVDRKKMILHKGLKYGRARDRMLGYELPLADLMFREYGAEMLSSIPIDGEIVFSVNIRP
ncbi:MAG: histidine kinase dimerization/phospho-acceptor domain-containing protein [Candidatus Omnitrophica bacterium]|nr:histidine kinase dimerization/phospho-acceptor domain-containing protein [Candidatus Omnitrophota bacterium]